jgi:hypothetical protein
VDLILKVSEEGMKNGNPVANFIKVVDNGDYKDNIFEEVKQTNMSHLNSEPKSNEESKHHLFGYKDGYSNEFIPGEGLHPEHGKTFGFIVDKTLLKLGRLMI